MKKFNKNAWIRKANALLQKVYVPLNPKCLLCGNPTNCMHHFVYKSQSNNLKYDAKNLVPLCSRCHSRYHLSGDPMIHANIVLIKGRKWVKDLESRRRIIFKMNKTNLTEVIKNLEKKL